MTGHSIIRYLVLRSHFEHNYRNNNKNNKVPGAKLRKEANPIVTHEPQEHKHNSIYHHKLRIHKINKTFSLKH